MGTTNAHLGLVCQLVIVLVHRTYSCIGMLTASPILKFALGLLVLYFLKRNVSAHQLTYSLSLPLRHARRPISQMVDTVSLNIPLTITGRKQLLRHWIAAIVMAM